MATKPRKKATRARAGRKFASRLEQKQAVRAACLVEYERLYGRPFRLTVRARSGRESPSLPPLTEDEPDAKRLADTERKARDAFEALRRAVRDGLAVAREYAAEAKRPALGLLGGSGALGGRTPEWPAAARWLHWLADGAPASLLADGAPWPAPSKESRRTRLVRFAMFSNACALGRELGREPTPVEVKAAVSPRALAIVTLLRGWCWPSAVPLTASVAEVIDAETRAVRAVLRRGS